MKLVDCTICLQPVSMKEDRAQNRVWDSDVSPGGWCHRQCWDIEHAESGSLQQVLRDALIKTPGGPGRQTLAARRVQAEGELRVRR